MLAMIRHFQHQWPLLLSLMAIGSQLTFDSPVWAQPAANGYRLVYKFQPNQFVHYEVANRMSILTQFGDTSTVALNESTAVKNYRVISVDGQGGAVIEPTIVRVKMSAQFAEQDAAIYDSETAIDPPPQFKDVAATLGRPSVRLQVAANGQLIQATPLLDSPANRNLAKDDPRHNFLIVFPTDPVPIGGSWKDRFQVPVSVEGGLKREVTLQRTFTLTKVNGNSAFIQLKTAVMTPVDSPAIEAQLIQRTPSGVLEFDMAEGAFLGQELRVSGHVVNAFGEKTQMKAESLSVEKRIPSPTSRGIAVLPASGGTIRQ